MPIGRPTILTPELAARICGIIAAGNYSVTAAAACGIAESTFYEWLGRGRAGGADNEAYSEFSESVAKARGVAEMRHVKVITDAAGKGNVAAAQFWLERTHPERWGRRDAVKVEMALERELASFLDACERALDRDTYERVLAVAAGEAGIGAAAGAAAPGG